MVKRNYRYKLREKKDSMAVGYSSKIDKGILVPTAIRCI
jgi:hypothetical protein